ncbi:MAG: hypothetical protein QM635_00290 [Microbacteriaceae bacterium]
MPTFGHRLIADELADVGSETSERRVWRSCSESGIVSVISSRIAFGCSIIAHPLSGIAAIAAGTLGIIRTVTDTSATALIAAPMVT